MEKIYWLVIELVQEKQSPTLCPLFKSSELIKFLAALNLQNLLYFALLGTF